MKRKSVAFILISTLAIILCAITIYAIHSKKYEDINETIKTYVNTNDILYTESPVTNTEDNIVYTPENTRSVDDNSYTVEIKSIRKKKINKYVENGDKYYKYTFKATIAIKNGDTIQATKTVNSHVIIKKEQKNFLITSYDDLKQDISKEIIKVKEANSEDITKEFDNISLLYENEELDITISYPDTYTYINNDFDNNDVKDNISFYFDEHQNKSDNYLNILLDKTNNEDDETSLEYYLEQGYVEEESLETYSNITFRVATQSFYKENDSHVIERIYISDEPYKELKYIKAVARATEENLTKNQIQIEEIIKSIK